MYYRTDEPTVADRQAHWNARASSYDLDFEQAPVRTLTLEKVLTFLPERAERVVDAGAGTGRTLRSLMARYGSDTLLVGLDFSAEMLLRVRRHGGRAWPFRLISADHAALPFGTNSIDVLVSTFTLHHVPPSQQLLVLKEFRRVLQRDGTLVLADQVQSEPPLDPVQLSSVVVETFYPHLAVGDGLNRLAPYGEWPVATARLVDLVREAGFSAPDVCRVHRIVAVLRARAVGK